MLIEEKFYKPLFSLADNSQFARFPRFSELHYQMHSGRTEGCFQYNRCSSAACWACATAASRSFTDSIASQWSPTGQLIEVSIDELTSYIEEDEVVSFLASDLFSRFKATLGQQFKGAGSFYLAPNNNPEASWTIGIRLVVELNCEDVTELCERLENDFDPCWSAIPVSLEERSLVEALTDAAHPAVTRHFHSSALHKTDYPASDRVNMLRMVWLVDRNPLDLTIAENIG